MIRITSVLVRNGKSSHSAGEVTAHPIARAGRLHLGRGLAVSLSGRGLGGRFTGEPWQKERRCRITSDPAKGEQRGRGKATEADYGGNGVRASAGLQHRVASYGDGACFADDGTADNKCQFCRSSTGPARRPGRSVAVPCAGCSACCWAKYIEVEPELERPEDLAVLNVAPNPIRDGFMLAKRPDGACGHLDAERGLHRLRTPTAGMPTIRLPPVCDHRRGGQI